MTNIEKKYEEQMAQLELLAKGLCYTLQNDKGITREELLNYCTLIGNTASLAIYYKKDMEADNAQ